MFSLLRHMEFRHQPTGLRLRRKVASINLVDATTCSLGSKNHCIEECGDLGATESKDLRQKNLLSFHLFHHLWPRNASRDVDAKRSQCRTGPKLPSSKPCRSVSDPLGPLVTLRQPGGAAGSARPCSAEQYEGIDRYLRPIDLPPCFWPNHYCVSHPNSVHLF